MIKLAMKLFGVVVAIVAGVQIGSLDRTEDRRLPFVSTIVLSFLAYLVLVQRWKHMLVVYPAALLFGFFSLREYLKYYFEQSIEETGRITLSARSIGRRQLGIPDEELDILGKSLEEVRLR